MMRHPHRQAQRPARSPRRGVALAALLACASAPALALGVCGVSATPLAFGGYDVFSTSPTTSTSTITVSCLVTITLASVPYTISLGPSATSGTMARELAGPSGARLQYNLSASAGGSPIWGDGSGGSQALSAGVTPVSLGVLVFRNHTVYGSIPALQNVRVGAYGDSILVTVDY